MHDSCVLRETSRQQCCGFLLQMGDLTLLPDGTVFLCNGAQIGEWLFRLICPQLCSTAIHVPQIWNLWLGNSLRSAATVM